MKLLNTPPALISVDELCVGGEELKDYSNKKMQDIRGKKISMIFQDAMSALNPVMTVGRQIQEVFLTQKDISKKEAKARAIKALELVGIPEPARRYNAFPHQLSGGLRQRVLIAMAFACNPELIIADEPTTALDVTVQQQILALLRELREDLGASSLLITHDLGVIAQNCDRVIVMYAGRIVESAPVEELFANPRHAYTKALLAAMPRREYERKTMLPSIPGHVASIRHQVKGCRFCQRMGISVDLLTDRPPMVEIAPGHRVEACPRCFAQSE
jgi:oligopeptide/dipeptide ABC transporter ATP-binding protein